MFTRLLVGVDGSPGSEVALATAIELARRFSCTIVLATVTDLRALEAPMLGAPLVTGDLTSGIPSMAGLQEVLRERGSKALAGAEARVRAAGVAVESIQTSGLVPDMLLALADEAEALVIGRHGETHTGAGSVGAETSRLVRRSPRPVLVAGEQVSSCLRPVVAYDGGETSGNALTFAARYAEATKVRVDVVHVADEFRAADELLARAGAYLSGTGVDHVTHRLEGSVADAVAAHVAGTAADLVLVGAHSGRRRRTWSIGSQADKLVRTIPVPIIVVR